MPTNMRVPVIVGVDGSPGSLAAVDLAAEEAVGRVCPLVVAHVSGRSPGAGVRGEAELAARDILDVAVARAASEHPGLSVSAEHLWGDPVQALIARSANACVVVVGYRGRRGLSELGSVATQVGMHATVPVIVHRPLDTSSEVSHPRPVLVGVGSDPADEVLEFAFTEAALRGAPLQTVHIWSESGDPHPTPPQRSLGFEAARDEAHQMLVESVLGWSQKYPDVQVRYTVRHSLDTPVALTAASRSAQLVVVGSSHRGGSSLRHGSVGRTLIHRAGCPVAIVPATIVAAAIVPAVIGPAVIGPVATGTGVVA